MLFNGDPDADLILNHILARGKKKKISLERGPQGEWDPGRAARARQKGLKIEAILARARRAARPGSLSPQGPLSKEIVLMYNAGQVSRGACMACSL